MIISSNIKKYREEKNYTQEELAAHMNISRQSISKWERGDSLPSIDNLISLSDLLDLSLDELILNKGELPLPIHYGKFKSRKTFVLWMSFPLLLFICGLFSLNYPGYSATLMLLSFWIGGMIQEVGYVDLRRMYNYFTVTKVGIESFQPKSYRPKLIREIQALFGKRETQMTTYQEIAKMEIYFNNQGFQGHNTTVAYRPRQFFYNREWFELVLHLKNGELIRLNLDLAYFPDSDERRYFCAMFDFFQSRGIQIVDEYHILNSIQNEYSLIEEAYKLKNTKNK